MRRWSLVFAVLVLSTTSARASEPCTCATEPVILPVPGAREVPRNTKVWVVGEAIGRARLEGGDEPWIGDATYVRQDGMAVYQVELRSLAEARAYVVEGVDFGPSTQFTTGSGYDTTPPAPPEVRTLAMAVSEYGPGTDPVGELVFDAALDPDVVLLHFTFTSGEDQRQMITTVDGWRSLGRPACRTELPFVPPGGQLSVAVSAIDLAGNESAPATREVEVWRGPPTRPACAQTHHRRCGTGEALLLLGVAGAAFLVIPLLIVWLVRYFQRMRARQLAIAEPISLLVAERIARVVQRRGGVLAAVGIAGVPALVGMDHEAFAIVSTIVGCVGLRGFCVARAALRLMAPAGPAGNDVIAETLGPTVVVRGPTDEVRLDVTPRALAAALRHAVPTSIATWR